MLKLIIIDAKVHIHYAQFEFWIIIIIIYFCIL
jgi:hypothetical protein